MTCPACIGLVDAPTTYCGHCGSRIAARDRLVGTMLDDRYRIVAKIAAGGFGTIYRAVDRATDTEVAVKVLHASHNADPSVSARFRREAVAMSSLRDPHTVSTYELGEAEDGTRFIVMELLHGESLAERFAARGALHWRSVLAIVRGVCDSLAEAHALGIVHRDLKPANIFLAQTEGDPDFVKVLDFGIAKIIHGSNMHDGSEITRIGQAIGTLEYMSPEQLVGGDIDGRSDIYTLGVVMYEMITGRRPFNEVTGATGLVTALMTRRPPPPSTVISPAAGGTGTRGPLPPALDGVLLRCLERDTEDRYDTIHELAAAIDRMLATPRSDVHTTQQLWLRGGPIAVEPVFADADSDAELTWIDALPPFDPHELDDTTPVARLTPERVISPRVTPERVMAPHGLGLALAPRTDDVVRTQIAASPTPPRTWRVAGTGNPFDLGEEPTQTATPRSMFAVGSSPIIAGPVRSSECETPAPATKIHPVRMVLIAALLTALGLGIGAGIATLAL